MFNNVGHIKNPLSIIAIFAAIAEIFGTGVLPLLEPENQSIFIWFLMFFPCLLVSVFFVTLNFNHKVLYAPSDYKDDEGFFKAAGIVPASPYDKLNKIKEEAVEEEEEKESAKDDPDLKEQSKTRKEKKSLTKALKEGIEKLEINEATFSEIALSSLLKKYKGEYLREVKLSNKNSYIFDAIINNDSNVLFVEFKKIHSFGHLRNFTKIASRNISEIFTERNILLSKFKAKILICIYTEIEEDKYNAIVSMIETEFSKHNLNVEIKIFTYDELVDIKRNILS